MFTGAQSSPFAFYSSGGRPLSCSPQSRVGGGGGGKIDTDSLRRKGSLPLLPWASEGGIGGELRKLLSLSLSPWVGRGRLAAAEREREREREREERFFKRAGDVGAAVWLCPALGAG